MNNRKWNAKNPHQGQFQKALCVCSAGLLRSPTLALVLANEPYNYNTRAVGIDTGHALVPMDEVLAHWADIVFCVNNEIANEVLAKFPEVADIMVILDVPDIYPYRDNQLIEIIRNQLGEVN